MKRSKQNKSCHIARRVDKQEARPSVSDQAGVEKLATESKSPVNKGQEASHTRLLPNNGSPIINTNNVTKTKNTKQKWNRDEYREIIESYYTATFFPSRKSNTVETYEIWREKNHTARPNMDLNKLAKMQRTIIKNKYLSEMEIDEIKLKVQSKCENQLSNVEANNNGSHSDQQYISEPDGNVESQNTPSLQTYVNPEQISNNVQNSLSPEVLNIDPQSQPELDKINELKEKVLVEWIKVSEKYKNK